MTYPLLLAQRLFGDNRSRRRLLIRLLIFAHSCRLVHAPPRCADQDPCDLVADGLRRTVARDDGQHLGLGVAMVWPGGWRGTDVSGFFGGEEIAEATRWRGGEAPLCGG